MLLFELLCHKEASKENHLPIPNFQVRNAGFLRDGMPPRSPHQKQSTYTPNISWLHGMIEASGILVTGKFRTNTIHVLWRVRCSLLFITKLDAIQPKKHSISILVWYGKSSIWKNNLVGDFNQSDFFLSNRIRIISPRFGVLKNTLQGTNISPKNGILKMIFLFPRWDMLIPWRVLETTT